MCIVVRGGSLKGIRYLREYFATHFAAVFAFYISVAVFVIAFIFMTYLKNEYEHYLWEKGYETEDAVMEAMQRDLNASFRELITTGSEMVTDRNLLELTVEVDREDGKGVKAGQSYLNLYNALVAYDHLRFVSAVAVVGKDGMICQYDRYKLLKSTMWDDENLAYVEEMAAELFQSIADDNLPRYMAHLYPHAYPDSERKVFHVAYPLTGGVTGIRSTEYAVVITYSMEVFDTFLNTVEVPQVKYIHGYITDEQGEVLYYNNARHESLQDFLRVEEREATLIAKPLEYFGWTANVIMDETQMKAHVEEIYRRGLTLYMLILMVYVMIIIMVIRRLLNPIHSISESLKAAERGDYNSKIRIEGRNEIWQLAE